MRLTPYQHKAIKDAIHYLDPNAKIYLFGSRTDDLARGGDIDLLIFSEVISEFNRRELKLELFDRLGEQKIDLVMAKDLSRPFIRIAYEKGVPL